MLSKRFPHIILLVLFFSILFAIVQKCEQRMLSPDAECVALDAEATPGFVSADIDGVKSYVGVEAMRLHVWMDTVGDPDTKQPPSVGRMRLRIPVHSRNWTEVVPQYAPGTVHTCERRGPLSTLFHVKDAWHSRQGLSANEAGGFAAQRFVMWEMFQMGMCFCTIPFLTFAVMTVVSERNLSDAEVTANLKADFRSMCRVTVYPIVGLCILMLVATFAIDAEIDATCKVLAAKPLSEHVFRIWAATDNGAAQFDYTTMDPYERPDLMALGTKQASVSCSVSAYATHPREIIIRRYTGAIVTARGSDDNDIRLIIFYDRLLVCFIMLINALVEPFTELELRREGITSEKTEHDSSRTE